MRIIAQTEVPANPGYFHLGYVSGAPFAKAENPLGLAAVTVIVLALVIRHLRS